MKGQTRNLFRRSRRVSARQRSPEVTRTGTRGETDVERGDTLHRSGAKAAHRVRVLVAEDDRRVREGLAETLVKLGMRVRKVDNPYDVVSEVEAFRPEVVFLDDHFHGSGAAYRSIIPQIRSRFPRVRVVVTYDKPKEGRGSERERASAPLTWGAVASIERGKTVDGASVSRYVKDAVEA